MRTLTTALIVCGLAVMLGGPTRAGYPNPRIANSPKDGWDWRFRDFVIGAWWGPGFSEPEVKLYREAGFNLIMCGRYMELDNYGDPIQAPKELDLAHKYGLGVMFDTYTKNDRPWGGTAGQADGHPTHHAASLVELKWLYDRLGKHPALVGFMIGDDKSALNQRLIDCTDFLRETAPSLMPWICQNHPNPSSLAQHGNPIYDTQIYPTLYSWKMPADEHVKHYARVYAGQRDQSRRLDLLFWPMFNVATWGEGMKGFKCIPTDSLARFPAYAAIAYGAQGIMYFTYNGGAIQEKGVFETEDAVRKALSPLYPVVKKQNLRIAAWGPKLIGADSTGLFGTAWAAVPARGWPFLGEVSPEGLVPPGAGKLVEEMGDKLIVGILTKKGEPPLAMVVDARASKSFGDLPTREVTIRFNRAVSRIEVLEGRDGRGRVSQRPEITLALDAGEGQLLALHGGAVSRLAASRAIRQKLSVGREQVSETDLAAIRKAKLRIDVFDTNAEAKYADKTLTLNGAVIGRVPANRRPAWDAKIIDLGPEQLRLIASKNTIRISGAGVAVDAWKFRGLTLAVQLQDGRWVRTTTQGTIYCHAPGWAYFEGEPIPASGEVPPIVLSF